MNLHYLQYYNACRCKTSPKSVQFFNMSNVENTPYSALGSVLRAMRLRRKESLLEVSASVEITGERLALFENGELRPSEDILELLIAHFDAVANEEDRLWELAGYKKLDDMQMQQAFMFAPLDTRIAYTDMVHVMVNNYGVVINFMQSAGPNIQPVAVSRIGMSREHANSVLEVLQKTLAQADKPAKEIKKLDSPDKKQKSQ